MVSVQFILAIGDLFISFAKADNAVSPNQIEQVLDDTNTTSGSLKLDSEQINNIDSQIQEKVSVVSSDNESTATLTDDDLIDILSNILTPQQLDQVQAAKHHQGVTKIIWHGKARYGNVDIYLSKRMLNALRGVSITAGYTIMYTLLSKVWPYEASIEEKQMAKFIITNYIKHTEKGFSYGRKFIFRSWKFKGV
ncbi:hypothetical protein [Lactobacillus sp.]|uniref:hypothetical protein n=1 Tax=Lactobacillus sp. TaxID=1591 RepID=UPI003EF91A66